MKKLALAAVASTFAFVGATQANISTGFYAGGSLGYGVTSGTLSKQGAPAGGNVLVGGFTNAGYTHLDGNAFNLGLMAGYGVVANCWYVGGEIGYTFENTKLTTTMGNTASQSQLQLKRVGYFNAALRGGFLFTPSTLIYVRLGGNIGRWTMSDTLLAFNNNNPGYGNKTRLTFVPGIGIETVVHRNIYVRLEYTYEWGPSIRATNGNATYSNNFSSVSTLRTQTGRLGVVYKF